MSEHVQMSEDEIVAMKESMADRRAIEWHQQRQSRWRICPIDFVMGFAAGAWTFVIVVALANYFLRR